MEAVATAAGEGEGLAVAESAVVVVCSHKAAQAEVAEALTGEEEMALADSEMAVEEGLAAGWEARWVAQMAEVPLEGMAAGLVVAVSEVTGDPLAEGEVPMGLEGQPEVAEE